MSTAHASPEFDAVDSGSTEGPILAGAGVTRWTHRRTRRPLVAG